MSEFSSVSEQTFVSSSQTSFLQQILTNQEQILKNQSVLLRAERNRRIWGIVKIVFIVLLVLVPLFLLPIMLSSMMGGAIGGSSGGMSLDAILGNPDALEQLLMGQ
jgi:hypothetical protein